MVISRQACGLPRNAGLEYALAFPPDGGDCRGTLCLAMTELRFRPCLSLRGAERRGNLAASLMACRGTQVWNTHSRFPPNGGDCHGTFPRLAMTNGGVFAACNDGLAFPPDGGDCRGTLCLAMTKVGVFAACNDGLAFPPDGGDCRGTLCLAMTGLGVSAPCSDGFAFCV